MEFAFYVQALVTMLLGIAVTGLVIMTIASFRHEHKFEPWGDWEMCNCGVTRALWTKTRSFFYPGVQMPDEPEIEMAAQWLTDHCRNIHDNPDPIMNHKELVEWHAIDHEYRHYDHSVDVYYNRFLDEWENPK